MELFLQIDGLERQINHNRGFIHLIDEKVRGILVENLEMANTH